MRDMEVGMANEAPGGTSPIPRDQRLKLVDKGSGDFWAEVQRIVSSAAGTTPTGALVTYKRRMLRHDPSAARPISCLPGVGDRSA